MLTVVILFLVRVKKKLKARVPETLFALAATLLLVVINLVFLKITHKIAANPTTNVFGLDFSDNSGQTISAAGHARFRYGSGTNSLQMSLNSGSYIPLGSTLAGSYLIGGQLAAAGDAGKINLSSSGGPFHLVEATDTSTSIIVQQNSDISTGPWIDMQDSAGVSRLKFAPTTDGFVQPQVTMTSSLNGSYPYMIVQSADGAFSCTLTENGGALVYQCNGGQAFIWFDTNGNVKFTQIDTTGLHADRFSQINANVVAFSATPAFNCTSGNTIHFGPVTANITGPTMADGLNGEHCTIVMEKNATASAFTVTASWGANVRVNAGTFSTGSASLLVYKFVWDTSLATPAWVQESAAVTVP